MTRPQPSLDVVTTERALAEAVAIARQGDRVGLDTEFMRERTYSARLCLVQIATIDRIFLIDATVIDVHPVTELLAEPSIEVLVHAGRQDLELFYDRYEVVPSNVYDVQLAAAFAGFGSSLPYGRLVQDVAGTTLEKGEAYTDWCRRPLSRAQLTYAANDVRYLLDVADRLKKQLAELGRTEWVAEEMALLENEDIYRSDPANAWKRVTGRGALSARQTAVLREVARWREHEAARRDIPRGWVVKDPTLIEIARRAPTSLAGLKDVRGLNGREAERSANGILAAVAAGREAPAISLPAQPSRVVLARARMLSGLADAVVRARCERAGVAPELIATRGELESLLADSIGREPNPARHKLLKGWRRDLAGDAVLALSSGRLAVRVIDDPPYIEEVPL